MYFPDHYGNNFIYGLLKNSKCKFLVGKSVYGFGGTDKDIIEYFELLGVNKYPKEVSVELNSDTFSAFFKSLKGFDNISSYLKQKHSSGSISIEQTTCTIKSLDHIEHILKQPFSQIIIFLHLLENERKSIFDRLIDKTKETDEIKASLYL